VPPPAPAAALGRDESTSRAPDQQPDALSLLRRTARDLRNCASDATTCFAKNRASIQVIESAFHDKTSLSDKVRKARQKPTEKLLKQIAADLDGIADRNHLPR
jgi:hypothetical protein